MLIRDRLLARIAEMGGRPDHQRLAAEVLGIRNAPPELARRLVAQALVVEDRRDVWRRAGEQIAATAPDSAGVYVLRDEAGTAVMLIAPTSVVTDDTISALRAAPGILSVAALRA